MSLAVHHEQTTSIGTGVLGHLMFSELRRDAVDHDRAALDEARTWLSWLTTNEFRGPGDTIGAARGRVAREINIPPSYARRLWNRAAEMTGVAGGVYRALQRAYEDQRIAAEETAEAELQIARMRHAEFIEETARLAAVRTAADAASMGGERPDLGDRLGGVDRAGSEGADE